MIICITRRKKAALLVVFFLIITIILSYKPFLRKYEYPLKYSEFVTICSEQYDVDPLLVYSVMKAESKFNPDAQSHKDAQGLMQITPETARWALEKMGLDVSSDVFHPETNIRIGTWYLAKLLEDHDENIVAALAAYNAGSSNVNKWKKGETLNMSDIQYQETYDYVYKTLKYYETYKKLYLKGDLK